MSRSVGCYYHPMKSGYYSLKKHDADQSVHRNVFAWVQEMRRSDSFRVDTYKKDTDKTGLIALADKLVPKQHYGREDGADFYVRRGSEGEDYQKAVKVLRAILALVGREVASTQISGSQNRYSIGIGIEELWYSQEERTWRKALDRYWDFVQPKNLAIEQELNKLDLGHVQHLDMQGWYDFLLHKYFRTKFTAPNRYATTTKSLNWYIQNDALSDLYQIKQDLFSFGLEDIEKGLNIAKRIRGLGTAGASGLLSILFPKHFGTVDQFAVKALRGVSNLAELKRLNVMNPEGLYVADGVVLIRIMRDKATQNNQHFSSHFWTPRKIDMILWTYGRNTYIHPKTAQHSATVDPQEGAGY